MTTRREWAIGIILGLALMFVIIYVIPNPRATGGLMAIAFPFLIYGLYKWWPFGKE